MKVSLAQGSTERNKQNQPVVDGLHMDASAPPPDSPGDQNFVLSLARVRPMPSPSNA